MPDNANGKSAPASAGKATGPAAGEEEQAGSERDRRTRQITVLTDEVGQLTGRVVELEADNKKWPQLIGRDTLTGLPNKITLFRILLPKIMREFSSSGPFSCIAIGLDQLGRVNKDFGWLMGDKMLRASARGLRK